MELQQGLTLEFFNPLKAEFPFAMQKFCDWIDEYKKAVGWSDLFNGSVLMERLQMTQDGGDSFVPKFHELPHALQLGIWITFERSMLEVRYPGAKNKYFTMFIQGGDYLENRIKAWMEIMDEELNITGK